MSSSLQDNIRQQHSLRSWLQLCGCPQGGGCQEFQYWEDDNHMFEVAMVEENEAGSLLPIRILSGTDGSWAHVGNVERPPGRQRFQINYFEPCVPYLPFFHSLDRRPFHVYELVGDCASPNDQANGWSSYVQIHSGIRLEQRRSSTRTSRASQAPVDNQLMGTVDHVFRVAPMRLGPWDDGASHSESQQTYGIAFDRRGDNRCQDGCTGCASCGGTDTPANSWERYYSLISDGTNIIVKGNMLDLSYYPTTIVAALTSGGVVIAPSDICIFKGFVCVSTTGGATRAGLYVAPIGNNGQIGSFSKVFSLGISRMCTNGRTLFMAGAGTGAAGAQIFMSENPLCSTVKRSITFSTVAAFRDIKTMGNLVVAGGVGGLIVLSRNRGYTWEILADPTGGREIFCVATNGERVFIGDEDAKLWSTCNGGYSWSVDAALSGSLPTPRYALTGTVVVGEINDIVFVNKHVGYFSSGDQIFSTYSGGAYWAESCPRMEVDTSVSTSNLGSSYYYRLAVPSTPNLFRASNHLAAVRRYVNGGSLWLYGQPLIEGYGLAK